MTKSAKNKKGTLSRRARPSTPSSNRKLGRQKAMQLLAKQRSAEMLKLLALKDEVLKENEAKQLEWMTHSAIILEQSLRLFLSHKKAPDFDEIDNLVQDLLLLFDDVEASPWLLWNSLVRASGTRPKKSRDARPIEAYVRRMSMFRKARGARSLQLFLAAWGDLAHCLGDLLDLGWSIKDSSRRP